MQKTCHKLQQYNQKIKMKQKNLNNKELFKNIKKKQDKQKNQSPNNQSEINDDSFELIKKKEYKNNNQNQNSNQEINQQDLTSFRKCISNQFKKSNFINFNLIKNKINASLYRVRTENNQVNNTIDSTQLTKSPQAQPSVNQYNKKKIINSHNRSQSCPFIDPLNYCEKNIHQKQQKKHDHGLIFYALKIDQEKKKKISMQYLTKNRLNKLLANSPEKNKITHQYSSSLTQSSNTVIVHNLPNETNQPLAPSQNLSSILYKKCEKEVETKTQKQGKSQTYKGQSQNANFLNLLKRKKSSDVTEKILQKKSLMSLCLKQEFFIKTKVQQKISQYELKQQKRKLERDQKFFNIRQKALNKLLQSFNKKLIEAKNDSIHFQMQSLMIEREDQ